MRILVDTNVFARIANPASSHHTSAVESLATVKQLGHAPCIVPQIIYEYWVVATRAQELNGLGLSLEEANADVAKILAKCVLIRDERGIFDRWHKLVEQHEVVGKTVHDVRLVAAMERHGIKHLLTFNDKHFSRFQVTPVHPDDASGLLQSPQNQPD